MRTHKNTSLCSLSALNEVLFLNRCWGQKKMLPPWFFILFYFFVMLVLCSRQYVTLLQFVRMALHELFFLLGGEPLQLIHEVIIHRTSFFCASPQHRLTASANKRTCYWIRCRDKGSYTVIYFLFFFLGKKMKDQMKKRTWGFWWVGGGRLESKGCSLLYISFTVYHELALEDSSKLDFQMRH